jgi:hypothetical protein
MKQQPLRAMPFFGEVPDPPFDFDRLQAGGEGCNRKLAAFARKFVFSPENLHFLPPFSKNCPQTSSCT